MKLNKLIPSLLAFAVLPAFAGALDAVPKKVGPVSYYGALHTSSGKIVGAKNGQEAMVRGMSLFWSDATGLPYYKNDVITWAVENLKMDVFRFAMGITYYDSDGGTANALSDGYSYSSSPDSYLTIIDNMVQAAIENDVYIILDWHSHRAENEQALAAAFFKTVATKYASIPNVIYEIYNEPVNTGWSTITSYANSVIPGIRASTENLVLVGTPSWSQLTQYGGLSYTNVGYVFHFYAGTHTVGTYGSRITAAKNSDNAVFITEWGTVDADGKGSANTGNTNDWISFMESNKISNCNWSLRQTNDTETSGMFEGSEPLTSQGLLSSATYSASGSIVKTYLTGHAQSWADSLTKGKRSGSCAFKHTTAKETDGQISGVLSSGCTYASSDENVVSVSGTNLIINGAGYAILTGNDNTQSIVTISKVAGQTITNFADMYCRYNNAATHSCSINRGANYSGTHSGYDTFDWILGLSNKTLEGATFTIQSLNPDIVAIKNASCTDATYCSTTQKEAGSSIIMYEFKKFGTAKIVATAPAVTGYRAMNDTITVVYRKGENKITNKFTDKTVAIGSTTAGMLPDQTLLKTPVTYTYNDEATTPYLSKSGTDLVAGTQNAIVYIKATAAETDVYEEMNKTIRVIVGDSASAVNLIEVAIPETPKNRALNIGAQIQNDGLMLTAKSAGPVSVAVFDMNGKKMFSKKVNVTLGTRWVSLDGIHSGNYIVKVSKDSEQLLMKWAKQ